jgi:hypothetical protein
MKMAGTEKKSMMSLGARALIVGISLGALFVACSNMLTGNDLKAKIGTDVTEANAETVSVTMAVSPSGAGTVSPSIGTQVEKVGVSFPITASPFSTYAFGGWTAEGSGTVDFDSATSATTNAKIAKAASDIVIKANYNARPKLVTSSPYNHEPSVLISRPIVLTFSNTIDDKTATLANIQILRGVSGSSADPVSISNFFAVPVVSGKIVTMNLASGYFLGSTDANYDIFVTVTMSLLDKNGNCMAAEEQLTFTTSRVADTTPPNVGAITVKKSSGTILPTGNLTNSTSLLVDFVAGDTGSPTSMHTKITDSYTPTVALYDDAYVGNIPVIIPSVEGTHTLTIDVSDASSNHTINTVDVVLDTTPPGSPGTPTKPLHFVNIAERSGTASITVPFNSTGLVAGDNLKLRLSGTTVLATHALSSSDLMAGSYTFIVSGALFGSDGSSNSISANLMDIAGNDGISSPAVGLSSDYSTPTVSSVSFDKTSGWLKMGSSLTMTVTTGASETGLVATAVSIDGVDVKGSMGGSGNSYTFGYTVSSGDSDQKSGSIPISITLTDQAGNTMSSAYTTTPAGSTSLKEDANAPIVSGVSSSKSGTSKIGDLVTLTIGASGESGLAVNALQINGVDRSASFGGSGPTYTATYSVVAGDADCAVGAVPISVTLKDTAGNVSAAYVAPPSGWGVDANAPTISVSGVTPSSGTLKIGDTLVFTIAGGETGLTGNTLSVNGQTAVLSGTGPGYAATYTVVSGNTDRAAGGIPVSLSLKDAAGNVSNVYAISPPSVAVDANAPTVALTSSDGDLVVNATAVTITADFNEALSGAPTVSISGTGVTSVMGASMTGSGTHWMYSWTPGGNGIATVDITASDMAGNALPGTGISGAKTYTVDTTPPGIATPIPSIGDAAHPTLSFTLNADDLSGASTVYYWAGSGSKPTGVLLFSYTIGTFVTANGGVFTTTALSNIGLGDFSFTVVDAAGNETIAAYGMHYTTGWAYTGTVVKSLEFGTRYGSSSTNGGSSSSSRSSSPLPFAPISFVDPVVYSSRAETTRDAAAKALDFKPIEARYAPPATERARGIDASSLSLLGRSAAAAAKAAGRVVDSAVEAMSPAAPATSAGEPSAGSASAPASTSTQGTGIETQSRAPASEPQSLPKGPSSPAKAPAPGVDLYVNQSRTKREDASEPLDDAEGSDIL